MQFLILFIQTVSQFLIGFITQPSLYNQLVLIIFGRCFDYTSVTETSIGSLSNDVFERRTSVGRGLFVLFGLDFERKFLRKLSLEAFSNSNLVALLLEIKAHYGMTLLVKLLRGNAARETGSQFVPQNSAIAQFDTTVSHSHEPLLC